MIDNPDYKGQWSPQQIENPHFFKHENPAHHLSPIGALAVEVWTTNYEIRFDNFYVGRNIAKASTFASETFDMKAEAESNSERFLKKEKREIERNAKLAEGGFVNTLEYCLMIGF